MKWRKDIENHIIKEMGAYEHKDDIIILVQNEIKKAILEVEEINKKYISTYPTEKNNIKEILNKRGIK
jgi:hypothetical protein